MGNGAGSSWRRGPPLPQAVALKAPPCPSEVNRRCLQPRITCLRAGRSRPGLLTSEGVLDAAHRVLSLALGLVGPPLGLEFGVAEYVAHAFLDRALGLLG